MLDSEKNRLVLTLETFVNKHQIEPLGEVSDADFKIIWDSIHRILPHLHPESIKDNGAEISKIPSRDVSFCIEPYFTRSGWPVELTSIALEANKRFCTGRLARDEYFHT